MKKFVCYIPINSKASGNMSDKFALQLSSTGSFLYLNPGKCSNELGLSCVTFKMYVIPYSFNISRSEESFSLPRYRCGRIWTGTFVRLSWWSVTCGVDGSSFTEWWSCSVSCIVKPESESKGRSTSSPGSQNAEYFFSNLVKPPENFQKSPKSATEKLKTTGWQLVSIQIQTKIVNSKWARNQPNKTLSKLITLTELRVKIVYPTF